MLANLTTALRLSTGHEGGYSNHPKDPGGPTNHGITQGTLSAFLGRRATIDDVKNLSLKTAASIYVKQYWRPINGDELPSGLDYAVFDFYINSGKPAITILQEVVGAAPDGVVGLKTMNAIRDYIARNSINRLIDAYCEARMKYLRKLKTFKTFGRGWTIRVTGIDPNKKWAPALGVIGEAKRIAANDNKSALALTTATGSLEGAFCGKGRDSDIKTLAPTRNKVQVAAGASAVLAGISNALEQLTPYKDTFEIIGYVVLGLTIAAIVATVIVNIDKIREAGVNA